MDFYSSLAPDYDTMTRTQTRLLTEEKSLRNFIDPLRHSRVLDLACGTGLHAITLARMGCAVTAADLSLAMLERARANAREAGQTVEWVHSSLEEARTAIPRAFDAVLCLGNSLPHLLTPESRRATFDGFDALTAPGGLLLLQLLNYSRVLATRERVVAINREGGREFVRFYDFGEPFLTFNVLTIEDRGGRLVHDLRSTPLFPLGLTEILSLLSHGSFETPEIFGGLDRSPFNPETSNNLVVAARKQ